MALLGAHRQLPATDRQGAQVGFEAGRVEAEIDQQAEAHVAGDPREGVEIKGGHDSRSAVDAGGGKGGAETVVDVDHRHPGGAGVEHAEQRGEAAEGRAVTDRGRHGDHRHVDQPADHRGQRPLHAGDDDDHRRLAQLLAVGQQAVQAGDADVGELDRRGSAEDAGGHRRLAGHRQVGGAGADHRDRPTAEIFERLLHQREGAGQRLVFACGMVF